LVGINTPQTLKIQGYIKKKKITVLINYDSTHNFTNYKLAKSLNCFLFPAPKFQIMITNGGTINCYRKFHNIKLNTGEYFLDSPMIAIQMGGVDVVLRLQWLQSSRMMALNFQDIFMIFSSKGNEIEFRGIQGKLSKVIISNSMTKVLKKGHHGVIVLLGYLDT
jgi:hypothetical protein